MCIKIVAQWLVGCCCLKTATEFCRRESLRQDERVAMSDERWQRQHFNASSYWCSWLVSMATVHNAQSPWERYQHSAAGSSFRVRAINS